MKLRYSLLKHHEPDQIPYPLSSLPESERQKAKDRRQKEEGILHGIKYSLKQRS
jgi:hypothetical protein